MKIERGYHIDRDWSMYELQQFFNGLRKTMTNISIQTMLQEYGLRYSLHSDMVMEEIMSKDELANKLGFPNNNTFQLSYDSQFVDRIGEALRQQNGWYWSLYGFESDVFVTHEGKILCIVRGNEQELLRAFEKYPYIKPYSYGDTKPDNIDDAVWEQRKKDWEEVLSNEPHDARMNGFTVTLVSPSFAEKNMDQLITHMVVPDVNQRAKRLAETYCDFKLNAENKDKDFGELLEMKKTKDYHKQVKERASYYKKKMQDHITFF